MGGEPTHGPMMTRICWRLFDILSRMLDADERQAVLGDLAESGECFGGATRDVLGLIVHRQIGLWTLWQPWLALLGVACLAGVPLSRIAFRFNVDLGQQLMAYQQYGVHFGTLLTPHQDMAFLLCVAVALLVWSWTYRAADFVQFAADFKCVLHGRSLTQDSEILFFPRIRCL